MNPASTTTGEMVMAPVASLHQLGRALLWSTATLDQIQAQACPDQLDFLATAMATEIAHREQSRQARLVKKAGFPTVKGFTGFDWTQVSLPERCDREMITSCGFINDHVNLVCYGPVGTGKTHFATAVGMAACSQGIPVLFTSVSQLVIRLGEAKTAARLEQVTRQIQRHDLIILDEWGYVPMDRDAARLLFQIIADAYETRSLIITTNVAFGAWGAVLTDDQLAAAMIDRIAHHGHLIVFAGDSYRMRHALMRPSTPISKEGSLK